jgi:DNA-binding transcriptional MerR regulator
MVSIGEFARLGRVSVRTLRHYDEIGLLRPAKVDPDTGYRGYGAGQLGRLNRILAMKDLGLSLAQIRRLLGGITLEELQGMLMLRRAQLETELQAQKNKLLGVEARLRFIATEGAMPADDITVKKIPAMGVVAISALAPDWENEHIVPAVNRSRVQFDELGIPRHGYQPGGPHATCGSTKWTTSPTSISRCSRSRCRSPGLPQNPSPRKDGNHASGPHRSSRPPAPRGTARRADERSPGEQPGRRLQARAG